MYNSDKVLIVGWFPDNSLGPVVVVYSIVVLCSIAITLSLFASEYVLLRLK